MVLYAQGTSEGEAPPKTSLLWRISGTWRKLWPAAADTRTSRGCSPHLSEPVSQRITKNSFTTGQIDSSMANAKQTNKRTNKQTKNS